MQSRQMRQLTFVAHGQRRAHPVIDVFTLPVNAAFNTKGCPAYSLYLNWLCALRFLLFVIFRVN